ncbi:MAG: ABC transporter ATP-binding protein [Leptotrichiaceae bacterium]|nr:ABC transporter ATP-binding protein [Leptotrichiaceae bacterium]
MTTSIKNEKGKSCIKLETKNVSVQFEDKKVIENISVRLHENELVCILGLSGVGKTTLFNVIAGLLSPNGGTVEMNGKNITGKSGNISYMLQKDLLLPFKTVIDNVSLPLVIKGESKKTARKKAEKYFRQFGLEGTERKYPGQLSGGMKQRAALLRTYMFSNEVALLDEPFSALDAITKHKMHMWYLDIMKEIKMSTLFITHDIDEAILLSDRIYILSGSPGKITAEIGIEMDRKGNNEEIQLSEKFLNYKREILSYLK